MAVRVVPVSDETRLELDSMGGVEMDLIAQDIQPAEPDHEDGDARYNWTSRMLIKSKLYIRDFLKAKGKDEPQ